ncbi:MAG: RluA family pseudouridine synthase [Solobacterium sp.]|nr:RluA family pseudouridine synthase [Solobacterium sp.]MDD7775680.1 RluA family pseudouridine synthase [Solobacterium sp.]MDY2952931.1 RluA family pseudouridine synthase [Erysipelotrichaceae bacterium]MDY5277297.1 RluA family pseudouridine synthase [Erysipelotrichaceae bacterium]
MPKLNLIVDDNYNVRLDAYLTDNTPLSRSNIQKLIKEEKILVNDKVTSNSYKVKMNDDISVEYEETVLTDLKPADIPIDIVYEDEDIIVINKQKGLVVHPAPGNYDNTLVNALLFNCKDLSDVNGFFRPGIVHRIDKDTSGLLVIAKNNEAHNFLSEQLKDKTCYRKYYAIVKGTIENNKGEINAPIGRNPKDRQKMCVTATNSKEAITEFEVIKRFGDCTLLDVSLLTGRTHQIRVHMAFIHHPVMNDEKYGGPHIDETGQFLHAYYLSFIHPRTKERVSFETPMPKYMEEYIESIEGINGK